MSDREQCQTCDELESRLDMLQSELSDLLESIEGITRVLETIQDFTDQQTDYAKKIVAGHHPRLAWSFAKGLETTSAPLARLLRWALRLFRQAEKRRKVDMAARMVQAQLSQGGYDCRRCNRLNKGIIKGTIRLEKEKKTYRHLRKICGKLVERSYSDCEKMCPTLTRTRGVPRPRFVYCKGRHQTPAVILDIFHVERPC